VSLPKTLKEVVVASRITTQLEAAGFVVRTELDTAPLVDLLVMNVLEAAGVKVDHDGKTLIYPSTQGTNTPRYQVPEQRNARFRGRRK